MKKFLRFHDLVEAGIVNNRMTLSRWIENYGFPKGLKPGPNTRLWTEDSVTEWLDQGGAGAD